MKHTILLILAVVYLNNKITQNAFKLVLKQEEIKITSFIVTATMYQPVASQCDSTPLITANGSKINPKTASRKKWIAVSRDLLKTFNYGDKVKITNAGKKNGIYIIVDCMSKKYGKRIDFLESVNTKPYKFKNVILTKV